MGKEASYAGRRDPRFVTIRRGGTLEDMQHRLLASWVADCAEYVVEFFCSQHPGDERPRFAIEQAQAWDRGEISMTQARQAAYAAHDAAKEASCAAREAAHTPCLVPAGSVVVFSSRVFHRSGPNTTNQMRRSYLAQYSAEPIMKKDGSGVWAQAVPVVVNGQRVAPVYAKAG